MSLDKRTQIARALRDKEYRELYVSEHIDTGVAFQLRAMRDAREWSQRDLGERANMAQETISKFENPDYGRLTLTSLKRLASAFDVAVIVRFAPFSQLLDYETHLSPRDLAVPSFDDDPGIDSEVLSTSGTAVTPLDVTVRDTQSVAVQLDLGR